MDIEGDTVAADGHCSLREATTAANNDVPPFMGAGECAVGAVSDVVTLPAGNFVLSRTATDAAGNKSAPTRLNFRVVRR